MNITSNYYNYYKTSSSNTVSALAKAKLSTSSSDTTTSTSNSTQKKSSTATDVLNLLTLSFSGMMFQNALQQKGTDTESSEVNPMDKLRTDLDAIKTADISSMSADEVKSTLANLQTDLKAMPHQHEKDQEVLSADLENMSEEDMKAMLTQIQEDINNRPERTDQKPPMEGFDLSQMTDSLSALEKTLQELTENYDSSTQSSTDYASQLKETLTNLFAKQKQNIDNLSNEVFNQIDQWSSSKTVE